MDLLEKKLLMEWRLKINKSKSCMQTTNTNYSKAVTACHTLVVSSDNLVTQGYTLLSQLFSPLKPGIQMGINKSGT